MSRRRELPPLTLPGLIAVVNNWPSELEVTVDGNDEEKAAWDGVELRHPDDPSAGAMYRAIVTNPIAHQFMREDGYGGSGAIIWRMTQEIERLRAKAGEPNERPDGWEEEEDAEEDAEDDEVLRLIEKRQAA